MGLFSTVIKAYTSQWKDYGLYQEASDCRGTGTVLRKYKSGYLKLYPCPQARALIEEFILPAVDSNSFFDIGFAMEGRQIGQTPCEWDSNDKSFKFQIYSEPEHILQQRGIVALEFGIHGIFLGMFNNRNFS